MVYLRDLPTQYPWNPNAEADFTDKEIYSRFVEQEDASPVWRIPLYEPQDGFAFVGFRLSVFEKSSDAPVVVRLVRGSSVKPMFGVPLDLTETTTGAWTPLAFPLTHKILAIGEDALDLLITHSEPCWGRVDVIAQRFDDLLEDETGIQYAFRNPHTDAVDWILSPDNSLYRPHPMDGPLLRGKSKVLPSVLRLLDASREPWADTSQWQTVVAL